MPERRRYTKRQKVTAVVAAEFAGVTAAAEQLGIPPTTLDYWMDLPEFVALRAKTREDLAEESQTLAHKVLGEIMRRLPEFEPRDLSILYGILTDKAQLLSGAATSRVESKDITNDLTDDERDVLRKAIREAVDAQETVPA